MDTSRRLKYIQTQYVKGETSAGMKTEASMVWPYSQTLRSWRQGELHHMSLYLFFEMMSCILFSLWNISDVRYNSFYKTFTLLRTVPIFAVWPDRNQLNRYFSYCMTPETSIKRDSNTLEYSRENKLDPTTLQNGGGVKLTPTGIYTGPIVR